MSLETVADMVAQARVLLQDRIEPYRYETDQLVTALNMGLQDARRIRPDLFLPNFEVPVYANTDMSVVVKFPGFFKTSLIYYIVGSTHMRDEEETSDARAAAMLGTFTAQLIGKTYSAAGAISPV